MSGIVCTPELANSVACFERATVLSPTDLLSGMQQTGPDRMPQSAGITVELLAEYLGGGSGGPFLRLAGGNVTGIVNFVGGTGSIQSNRNITLTGLTSAAANKPFSLTNTWTGTNLDNPPGSPQLATSITQTFNNFNTGSFGLRGLQVATFVGPLTVGATFSGVTSTVVQTLSHPPGATIWAPNTVFATNAGMTNPNNGSTYYAVVGGTSAPSGTGPDGYGQAIVDGSITWAYQGPGVPRYWAAVTPYPDRGELVINPNNGGLFRVETPGVSGAFPGPIRPRVPVAPCRVASTANIASLSGTPTIDGVLTVIGDRVLVKDQTAQADNGIYAVASGAWARSADADMWNDLVGEYTTATLGTVNAGLSFLCTVSRGGMLGTTPITWVQSALPNMNAIPDGSVVWSLRTIGDAAQAYIGLIANAQSGFNAGGKSPNESIGHSWGAVIGSRLSNRATFYSESIGLEVDDNMQGSCRSVFGLKVVRVGAQGQFIDVGIAISSVTNLPDGSFAPGYKNALLFNASINRDGGYGIAYEALGAARLQHMAGAIDTRMVVADGTQGPFGGGFIFRWLNGMLDQFGALQMRYGAITPTASGLTVDVPNLELTGLVITNGGANWNPGDGCKGSDGSFVLVRTVDVNGAILTIQIVTPSQVQSPAPTSVILSPFNPEAPFNAVGPEPIPGTVGPTGDVIWPTAAIATPTYAAPATPTINVGTSSAVVTNIGRTGQRIGFNGATAVTRPAATGSRGGNAALASLLTALASYGLITDSTTA